MALRRITKNDRDNAQRLRAIWDVKKKPLGLNQIKAAAKLGFAHQSTVSQYLNCDIALNTDSVLKFARLLEVDPAKIDPQIRSLVVRDLQPSPTDAEILCKIELADMGNYCVAKTATTGILSNPFPNDVPKGTTVKGVEIATDAYHVPFGLPHECVAYILIDAEPGINEVLFVQEPEQAGFYRFNGRIQDDLLLTDPLTGKTREVAIDDIQTLGVVIGHLAQNLERRNQWALN